MHPRGFVSLIECKSANFLRWGGVHTIPFTRVNLATVVIGQEGNPHQLEAATKSLNL